MLCPVQWNIDVILKNLLQRKTRTLLTLVGIAIGVAGVVALGAMAEGFINSYTTVLTSSGADVIVAQADAADLLFSAVDDSVKPQIESIGGVSQVSGTLMGMVTTPDVPYFIVLGVEPNTFAMRHFKIIEGKPLVSSREVLLGKVAAKNFKKKVGDNYKIQDVSYRVVGLYETGQTVEDMCAVLTLKDAQEVFKKPRQVAYFQVKVERPEQTDIVIRQLQQRFPKLMASRSANYMDNQQEGQMLRAMGWIIGLLSVIAGGLVMMNTMLMSVFERTREIGVLRALGWRKSRVLGVILGEALILSVIGGIAGIALGMLMVYSVNQMPAMAGLLDNALSPALAAQGMGIALLLGAVGGLYPAWRASQLQPVEAMRYDGSSQKSKAKSQKPNSQSRITDYQLPTALRNIFRQRTRTLLTTLTIGVGVGLVVLLGGMADGMIEQFGAMGSNVGDLMISEAKASDMSLAAIDDKVGRYVATLSDVEHVTGILLGIANMPGAMYFFVWGVDPNGYGIRHFAITEGERMRLPRDMLLGKVAAKNYKKHIGDTMSVAGNSYRIVGIYETGVGWEDGSGVIALAEAQRIFKKPNQVTLYGVKLRDLSKADLVRQQIETRMPQVTVAKSTDFAEKMNDMKSFRTMSDALSGLSIIVGGIGIMNAMLMSVFERTREIGTLRALGWRRRRVVRMIVGESLMLSIVSGVVGIMLGIGLGWLVTLEPSMGVMLKGSYSPRLLLQAMGIALILGSIGALYPAWRASNLSPIEALRYE